MLTEIELANKRAERNLASRVKARTKRQRHAQSLQDQAYRRRENENWMARIGAEQEKAQIEADARHKQALESRRTKAAMSKDAPIGFIGRVKSFFRGRGR